MSENVATRQTVITEADLEREGFSAEQIARLVALRDRYPLIEFVTRRIECERLAFLRWYYRNGRIQP